MKDDSNLGQSCCSLHGWIFCLSKTKGDYSIIIHSDKDCSNLVPKCEIGGGYQSRFFCTNLKDREIILGKSIDVLSECIDIISEEINPGSILVLESCISRTIGDDVKSLVEKKNEISEFPIFHRTTSGLKFSDPKYVLDEVGIFLFETSKKKMPFKRVENSINIFGFDPDICSSEEGIESLKEDLRNAGIKINAIINPGSNICEWEKLKNGALNVTFDKDLYAGLNEKLKEEYDLSLVEVPYPGSTDTLKIFLKMIGENLGLTFEETHGFLETMREVEKEEKKFVESFRGKKLIYNISSSLNFSVMNSAKNGLLMLDMFRGLGFDVEILIQGNPEEENASRVRKVLDDRGVDEKFTIFGHCGDAHKILKQKEGALVFGSDIIRSQASDSGCKFLEYTELDVGSKKIISNMKKLAGLI